MVQFAGIFPPIPTPFDSQGEIDPAALEKNLKWWGNFSLAGYVVLGSNGEAVLLEQHEKLALVQTVRRHTADDRRVIAGTGCPSTRATIALTRDAAAAGADAALVLPPFYYKSRMTFRALVDHFRAVADASPVPVLVYNMPACTGIDLDIETLLDLAGHENIAGLKDSSGNLVKLGAVLGEVPERFQVLAGSASFLLPALCLGAVGGILALANIAPQECLDLFDLARRGSLDPARALQLRLIPANTAVTRDGGVPALKAALDMLGQVGGPVRSPLRPLDDEQTEQLRSILSKAGLLAPDKKERPS